MAFLLPRLKGDIKMEPNWQPISNLPLIGELIDGQLMAARDQYTNLLEAQPKPHVLDDYTVDRVIHVYTEQLIFSATAEFERKMIKDRQREGIEIAKKKGKYKGRDIQYHSHGKGKDKLIYDKIIQMLSRKESVMEIYRETDVSRNTIYRIKRELEYKGGLAWMERSR
ncbi:helix-turn-helix domain-containing protein [Chengkuizengella marina]|uniref:Recombinase family protein n=1 Tax=Chengkuizengella marina TaxID=2507566 RepID=A0A6N9Q1R3_9BACL|nr:helix-turn-helix domain-containing protein [Chengkuizengella marina]NBI28074.1 recombinase family protein [Chengkuizengella marina]